MAKRVGVLLSGCGVFDGSEIHEAVSLLVALDRHGAQVVCLAPDIPQMHVIDHVRKQPDGSTRNVLVESARIARGNIRKLSDVSADELDAIVLPGGFGAAKNLCDFATKADACTVHPQVEKLLRALHDAGKPIGLACIAPVIAARLFGNANPKPKLTIGTDPSTAGAVEKMGATHVRADETGVVVDPQHKLVTTPCYMHHVGPWTVFQGASKLVDELMKLMGP